MTVERFVQLWTHRYFKYTHIFKAHWMGYLSWIRFCFKKLELKKGQELIAIVRTEHFGDIVAAEPISRYVREQYPSAHIVWFVKPAFSELVRHNPNIDEVFEEFCVTQRKVLFGTGVFDKIFELQFHNNNHCPKCQVFVDNPVALQRGINVHNYFNFGNLLQVFAKTGNLIPVESGFPANDQPRLYLQDNHRSKVDALNLKTPYIVVHCQSNFAPKDWPSDRWEKLIHWITENFDYQIVEIGLKSNLIINAASYRDLCGQLTILETAEVIRRAHYFIGLDSGPSHLGNATGTFGMILMGALNEFSQYNPYSGSYGREESARLIRKNGYPCSQLSFEFVRDEIARVLNGQL